MNTETIEPIWVSKNPVKEPHVFDTGNERMAVLTPSQIMNIVIEEVGTSSVVETLTKPMPGAFPGKRHTKPGVQR